MGDRYELGFAPALRFLRSRILCGLYKSPLDETISRGPPRVHTQVKRSHAHVKAPVVHVRVRRITETPKITQHVPTASSLQTDKVGHHTEEGEETPQGGLTAHLVNETIHVTLSTLHYIYTKTIPEQLQQFKSTAAKARNVINIIHSHALHERDAKELNLFLLTNVSSTVTQSCVAV